MAILSCQVAVKKVMSPGLDLRQSIFSCLLAMTYSPELITV